MRCWIGHLGLATGGLLLAACTTATPVDQVRAFANASEAFNAASQPLLDEVAVAERAQAADLIANPPRDATNVLVVPGASGDDEPRRVWLDLPESQVLALATIGDPPATAAFRKGVGAIKHYASVLVLLAEGQNIEAARAELGILATKLADVAALVPGAQAAPGLVTPLLGALGPLIDDAARAQNAAELRRLVLALAPQIHELNAKLRAGAEPLFRTLTEQQRGVFIAGGDANAAIAQIDAYRVAFANWLVLLDLVDQATDQLTDAVATPGNVATLASLAELSTRITTYAEGSRRALAVLRAGPQS
ncbi:MAG: hypothetical protein U1E14_07950 [Geminicoccaceae bacterium]